MTPLILNGLEILVTLSTWRLYRRGRIPVPLECECVWVPPGQFEEEMSLASTGFGPRTFQHVDLQL